MTAQERSTQDWSLIDELWRRLGLSRVAVRSSGEGEDGAQHSFAGVFESILNTEREDLADAIERVRASLRSRHSAAYTGTSDGGGIIVQQMVDAEYAGVLFTQHPSAGGLALVEMVKGTGDQLVSGGTTPNAYRFGRYSLRPVDDVAAPIDLQPLLALGRRAEALFGRPQDIEWAYRDGSFFILQSRDITESLIAAPAASDRRGRLERERARLLNLIGSAAADETVLAQGEVSELVPRPTPITLGLLEAVWRPGGSVDLACRALGIDYAVEEDAPPYLTTAFGLLYENRPEKARRTRPLGVVASFRLTRAAEAIERRFDEEFLPEFLRRVRPLEIADFDRLPVPELVALFNELHEHLITTTFVETEVINIAGSFYLSQAKASLQRHSLDPANYLSDIPETVTSRALAALRAVPERERPVASFLEVFGHRAQLDYELACPRYGEDPKLAKYLMTLWTKERRGVERRSEPLPMQNWRDRSLAETVTRARRFQALKEDAKHQALREIAVLRRLLLAIDRRLFDDQRVFFLAPEELSRLADRQFQDEAAQIADRRRSDQEFFKSVTGVPAELSVAFLEAGPIDGDGAAPQTADGALKGTRVAGAGAVIGRARVIRDPEAEAGLALDDLAEGEIVVSRMVQPQWLLNMPKAAGVVCEVGGWLSHTAILAREYNLPMVVGVRGLETIRTGDILRIGPDGSVERVVDEASTDLRI